MAGLAHCEVLNVDTMASLARPKRPGEDFARTHHNEHDQDGPSSSKKPRFDLRNPSALAPDALEEDAILDADEIGQRGQRVRRNAVNIEGYESDSENEGFDARAEAKANANKKASAADGDDMFAELEEDFAEAPAGTNKKKQVRFLQNEEIEGQVGESRSGGKVTLPDQGKGKQREGEEEESSGSDTDEEGRAAVGDGMDEEVGAGSKKAHAPLLDAFNMSSEQEEGRFDEAGNYIRKAVDPDAAHDSWLDGVSKKDIRSAKDAAEKREEERRNQTLANDGILASDVLKTLILHLQRGETILEALARIGKGVKQRPKWQTKNKNKSRKKNGGAEDIEMEKEDPEEADRKRAIEQITGAADILLSRGQPEIYDAEREFLVRQYKRDTGEDWVDPAASESSQTAPDDQNAMWEYRWSDARDNGETYGPFDRSMIESWKNAGYFGQGVEFRRVGGSGEWVATVDF